MGRDFYKILGVTRSSSEAEIKKAYKKLALKWHPDRVEPSKKDEAQSKFQEIGEAFDVLTDPEKKRIYDQVGEDGLKMGGGGGESSEGGGMPGGSGRSFHFRPGGGGGFRSPDDIFREFFSNQFNSDSDGDFGGGFPGSRGGMGGMSGMRSTSMPQQHSHHFQQQQQPNKSDPITHTLFLTLEDLYTGTTKRMRITKKVLDASGQYMQVATDKEISVKSGWKDGTKVTFEREGDEKPGYIPADICFVVQARKHERFERDGDDLIYTHPITLTEALCGFTFEIVTLDNRRLRIQEKKVTPEYVRIISGEGMPNSKKKTNGDLKVKFSIKFPELSDDIREQLGTILKSAVYR